MEPEGSLSCSQGQLSVPNLSQMDPVHTFPPSFLKILSNIILPSTPTSFEWPLPFRFSYQNFVPFFPMSATCPVHIVVLYLIALIMFG